MDVKTITDDEFLAIAERDEDHFFDLKAFGIAPAKVEKIAVAFANADGGDFVVGIRDKKDEANRSKSWQGISDIEGFNAILQVLFNTDPQIELRCNFLKVDGREGYALSVKVEKTSQVHKTSKGKVFRRYGAQSLPIDAPERIMELTYAKGARSYEDTLLRDLPAEQIVESRELAAFLSGFSPKTDALEYCINEGFLDFKTWQSRTAGALLYHASPQAVVPNKCAIKIIRYETSEETPERDSLRKIQTVEGPLSNCIETAISSTKKLIEEIPVWVEGELKKLSFPDEAIWEVIVNAVIHRDYSISDDVQILVFNNRIEVKSPGKLPGYVTVDNILDAKFARNSKIVRAINRYPAGYNKDLGEGLNTVFEKMAEWRLKEPSINEDGNYLRVVLPCESLATPAEQILKYLTTHDEITIGLGER